MKTCKRCNQAKPLFDFIKKCDTADGLASRCKQCQSETRKASYAVRGDIVRATNKKWYAEHRDQVKDSRKERRDSEKNKAKCKEYYLANKEKVRALNDAWSQRNPEKVRQAYRDYAKRKPEIRAALAARRRAARRQQYPAWDRELTNLVALEASHLARMRYDLFGFVWHVDHVIPLCGKNVSGLHVWNNLQVIPAADNQSKSNKYEVSVWPA